MSNSPIVPTAAWKRGLIEVYAPVLHALGATGDHVSTQNDGSIYLDVDATEDEFEAAGAAVLSTLRTKRGWHIVTTEGMQYAATNHPSERRAAPKSTGGSTLTPEEQARREKALKLKEKMQAIRDAQRDNRPDDETEDTDSDE